MLKGCRWWWPVSPENLTKTQPGRAGTTHNSKRTKDDSGHRSPTVHQDCRRKVRGACDVIGKNNDTTQGEKIMETHGTQKCITN